MNLRKLLAILLALVVVLSFVACDGGGGGGSSNNGGEGGNGGNGDDPPTPIPPAPLCFTAVDDDVDVCIMLTLYNDKEAPLPSLEMSLDGERWVPITINTPEEEEPEPEPEPTSGLPLRAKLLYPTTLITTLSPDSKVYIRAAGANNYITRPRNFIQFHFGGTGKVEASGNIMSLLDKTRALTEIPSEICFYKLFAGCEALTKAPELPATTLANSCYYGMFERCSSLTKAPELPATTLAERCYYGMFEECRSLKEAPVLPATILAPRCYESMFYNCTSLVSIEVSFTSWGNVGEYDADYTHWWLEMPSLGDEYNAGNFVCPPALYNATNAPGGDTIPYGWTVNGERVKWR